MNNSEINDIRKKIQLDKENSLKKVIELMASGVQIRNPDLFHIQGTISCGRNVSIDINVVIEGNVKLEDNVTIGVCI